MVFSALSDARYASPSLPQVAEVMADLACVLFRRVREPSGRIRYTWISPNCPDVFGFEPQEMTVTSKGALNVIHWADRDAHIQAMERSAETLVRCQDSFRAITAQGETRWFRGSAVPSRLDDGTIVWDGAWSDISPWMRAEHQFQTVMDHAEDVIMTVDARNGIDWMNAAAERLFGWSLDDLGGRCLSSLLRDLCRPQVPAQLSDCTGGVVHCFPRGTQEVMAKRKDGTSFPFEMTVSEVRTDGRLSLIVIGRDITRRKTTEQMLEESERRLRSIAANLPGVMFQRVLGSDGVFAYPYVSEGIEGILGCSSSDIVRDPAIFFDAMLDQDRERLLSGLSESADTLAPMLEDVRVVDASGRMRWLVGQSRPYRRDGSIVWDGLLVDATEEVEKRNQAELAVRESEERFRQAFAAASLGIVVATLDGCITQFNPAFQIMCARTGEDLTGKDLFAFVDRSLMPDIGHLPDPGDAFCFVYQPQLSDGLDRHWRISATQFSTTRSAVQTSLLFLIEDITEIVRSNEERRQLEMALTEGQKLEALGRLAGGVAHELNNMLGPILMGAEMMMRMGQLDGKNIERCTRIIEAAKHGRDIVRNVLAYCRKEQKVLGELDIVQVFSQFVGLATSVLPPSVKVDSHVALDSARVVGDAGQITQVLLNLANNARDAMDGRGTLGVRLEGLPAADRRNAKRRRRGDDAAASFLPDLDPAKDYVEIRIADTGSGMGPDTIARIFDPFFTTKPVGQGTGLGLSVVQGIIKTMGGIITVESELGVGTKFRIFLPANMHTSE